MPRETDTSAEQRDPMAWQEEWSAWWQGYWSDAPTALAADVAPFARVAPRSELDEAVAGA